MTNNEIELLNLIRESDDPTQALNVAIEIIISYLKQPESFEVPSPVCPQVLV